MMHSTHKRFVRELPMASALQVAARLALANVDFVLETKAATSSRTAYISCHFEETLDTAIDQVGAGAAARLRVALDPETPAKS